MQFLSFWLVWKQILVFDWINYSLCPNQRKSVAHVLTSRFLNLLTLVCPFTSAATTRLHPLDAPALHPSLAPVSLPFLFILMKHPFFFHLWTWTGVWRPRGVSLGRGFDLWLRRCFEESRAEPGAWAGWGASSCTCCCAVKCCACTCSSQFGLSCVWRLGV